MSPLAMSSPLSGRADAAEPGCDLCGLPLRFGSVAHELDGRHLRFCCVGCRQVFAMLLEAADAPDPARFRETDLFKQCRELGILPVSSEDLAQRSGRRGEDTAATPPPLEEGGPHGRLLELSLAVTDMWCPACAWVIEQALNKTPGIAAASCSFSTDRVRCTYDPLNTSPDRVIAALKRLGYRAAAPQGDPAAADRKRELIRFCVSALLSANVMMLSLALYSGFFSRFEAATVASISWPIFLMASGVFFYGGWRVHRKAFAGVARAAPGMETLVSIAATGAYGYSIFNLLAGSIHLYFDTASMLITLVLLGKILERRAKDGIQEQLGNFSSLQPTKARICSPQAPLGRYVDARQLAPGDVFRVLEGEIVPADGMVVEGCGQLDESSLTGEALPVRVKPGNRVRSGSQVLSGALHVRAEAVGPASLLGQMIAVMGQAVSGKTPLETLTDRLLKGFVPLILLLAAATAAVSLLRGMAMEDALTRCVTVLVIACPCALGIAIPLARVAGIAAAGRQGVLVRDFSAFERAVGLDTFVFDKTGTVTDGRWSLKRVLPVGEMSADRALALASGLESRSQHPVGRLIRQEAERRGIAPARVQGIVEADNGVCGDVGGEKVAIGSEAFVAAQTGVESRFSADARPGADVAQVSRVFMGCAGRLGAVFEFGDTLRQAAAPVLERLSSRGFRTALVSGDGDATTRRVGERIGAARAQGGMLPADKAAYVSDLQAQGARVAMVGDGVNDAPALAQADLGIAVHSGSHLGREAADITLMRGDPWQIIGFISLAGAVSRTIRWNLWCAFVYNIVSIPIAMGGLLNPLVAVCAMLLSSLTVIGNTLRLARRSETIVRQA